MKEIPACTGMADLTITQHSAQHVFFTSDAIFITMLPFHAAPTRGAKLM